MKYALKEWSTTIEALGKGLITAIWRKGGIDDIPSARTPYESFNVEQNQFVLFPTFTHQKLNKIKQDCRFLLDQNIGPNKDNQIKIKFWAEVVNELIIENFEQLISASKELVNSGEHLKDSWDLYPNHQGKILLLRVYSLNDPILITNSPEYSSCKSWIELKIDIPKSGSMPVLQFKEFNRKTRLVKKLVEQAKEISTDLPLTSI